MVFTRDILDNYKDKIKSPMYFYTHEEMIKIYKITKPTINDIMKSSCNGAIGDIYLNNVASHLSKNKNFDMVCVFRNMLDGTYSRPRTATAIAKYNAKMHELLTGMAGFIVMQKGECAMFPNTYAVNLLCSNKQQGKILLTLALYAIHQNAYVIDKQCVLELANGYINAPGLCMYSKLGFKYDGSLYTDKCFTDVNNLPMIIDLSSETENSIIQKLSSSLTSEKICEHRGEKQQWLGYLYNLKYIIANNNNQPLTISANEEVDYQKLHDYIIQNNTTLDQLIDNIEKTTNYDFTQINKFVAPTIPSAPAPTPTPTPAPTSQRITRNLSRKTGSGQKTPGKKSSRKR